MGLYSCFYTGESANCTHIKLGEKIEKKRKERIECQPFYSSLLLRPFTVCLQVLRLRYNNDDLWKNNGITTEEQNFQILKERLKISVIKNSSRFVFISGTSIL